MTILRGSTGAFGNTLSGGSESKSRFIIPEPGQFNEFQNRFGGFQGNIIQNPLQEGAVQEQRDFRGRLDSLLNTFGEGERNRINQDFQIAANNATGGLASRGFAGSSLQVPAALGVERERSRALGTLNDQLLGKRIEADTGITNSISDLLFGSSNQATDLIGKLLGTGGIGSDSSSKGGGGGGGGSSSIGFNPDNPSPPPEDFLGRFPGGIFGGGGGGSFSSGGGGSSGSAPPQVINNPFFPDDTGSSGGSGSSGGGGTSGGGGSGGGGSGGGGSAPPPRGLINPNGDPDDPDNWGPLNDGGPIQDPGNFAANQAELDRREAIIKGRAAARAAARAAGKSLGAVGGAASPLAPGLA